MTSAENESLSAASPFDESGAWRRKPWAFAVCALLLIAAATLPLWAPPSVLGAAIIMAIQFGAVLGLQITFGMGGQINLGQAAFVGFGALFTALAVNSWGLPDLLAILVGALASALVSAAFAIPAARIKGFYLALTSLAAQVLFTVLIPRLPESWFGGLNGVQVSPLSIFGCVLDSDAEYYVFSLAVSVCLAGLAVNLQRSRLGRALAAIRDNENAAMIQGVNVAYYKVMAFVLGGFYAGVAGGVLLFYFRYVSVGFFSLDQAILYLSMIIIGGLGHVRGAVVGVILVQGLQDRVTRDLPGLLDTILGSAATSRAFPLSMLIINLLFIVVLIWEPRGVTYGVGILSKRISQRWERGRRLYRPESTSIKNQGGMNNQ